MADVQPYPIPGAPGPGPAPVPYTGPDAAPEPPEYDAGQLASGDPGEQVLADAAGGPLQESAAAHDISAGAVDAPYFPGQIDPVFAGGDADAGGRDDVAGTVAGAVANAEARYHEHESDTYQQGSVIGDVMTLPPGPLDPGVVGGVTDPSGGFYDPPRNY